MSSNSHKRARLLPRLSAISAITLGLIVGVAATPAAALPVAAPASTTASVDSAWAFPSARSYVALGDSFTAGQGAPPYKPGACLQSKYTGYPTIAAVFSLYRLTENKACSGATIAATEAQLTGVSNKTALVTLTVGAIDLGSNNVLAACYTDPTSGACQAAVTQALAALPTLRPQLTDLYTTIANTLPNAKVAVLNYPHLFNPGVDPLGEVINTATDALNAKIQEAVAATGNPRVIYVDVTQEFAGHGIGSRLPYIAFDQSNVLATANFHPNALGNSLGYARALANDRVFSR